MLTNLQPSDLIYNALLIGMDFKSACLYAGLTESQISALYEDEEQMRKWKMLEKSAEFSLLEKLQTVVDKQMNMGKEAALTWMLERINPDRWSSKPTVTSEYPDININLNPSASFQDSSRVDMG